MKDSKLGEEILMARKQKGITQAELARLSKVTACYIGIIERGLAVPTTYTLNNILSVLK